MMEIIGPKHKVDNINNCSFNNNSANKVTDQYPQIRGELIIQESKNKQNNFDYRNDNKIMNIHLVIILSIFYLVEWSYDHYVYQVAYVDEDKHYQLDDWIVEADYKDDRCDKFIEIVEEWLSNLPRTNFSLNWEIED